MIDLLKIYKNFCELKDKSQYSQENWDKYFSSSFISFNKNLIDAIDFTKFSVIQLKEFGFVEWRKGGLLLAPNWAITASKIGTKFTSISGDIRIKGDSAINIKLNYRLSAYGLLTPEIRENKINGIIS